MLRARDGAQESRAEQVGSGLHCGERLHSRRYAAGSDQGPGEILPRRPSCWAPLLPGPHVRLLDWKGQAVDDGTYRLGNAWTVAISKVFPR